MKILETITLKQALEWHETEEKVCYICETFGIYAHMINTIETIEAYMEHLLRFCYVCDVSGVYHERIGKFDESLKEIETNIS